mgnify:CR=1 FL=1
MRIRSSDGKDTPFQFNGPYRLISSDCKSNGKVGIEKQELRPQEPNNTYPQNDKKN